MKLQVKLFQLNKEDLKTFEAVKTLGVNDENFLEDFATDIAEFSKDCINYVDRMKALKFNVKLIRKSSAMHIEINGLDQDDDINISLKVKNYGKFVENANKDDIKTMLSESGEFMLKHGDSIKLK